MTGGEEGYEGPPGRMTGGGDEGYEGNPAMTGGDEGYEGGPT